MDDAIKQGRLIQQVINLAAENAKATHGGPYAALVVCENKVIASSANLVAAEKDPTAHAEIMVIRQACAKLRNFQLAGCTLYTSCEPCPMCLGAIYWARLKNVYYACTRHDAAQAGFDDSFIYDEISLPPEQRHIPMVHVKTRNAVQPFEIWRASNGRINY